VDALGDGEVVGRQLRLRCAELRTRLHDVHLAGQPCSASLPAQIEQILRNGNGRTGALCALLRAAQLQIAARHIRQQCQLRRVLILDRGRERRISGLDRAADPAEQVHFPGGLCTELVLVVGVGNADARDSGQMHVIECREQRAGRRLLAEPRARVARVRRQAGPPRSGRHRTLAAGFLDAQHGGAQIEIGCQ
jgi:hypothetical protein